MKFNLPNPQPLPGTDFTLRVGNVYPCKGGNKSKYWVVVGLYNGGVQMIGINALGEISSTQNVGQHVYDGSSPLFRNGEKLLGHVDLSGFEFNVTWLGE